MAGKVAEVLLPRATVAPVCAVHLAAEGVPVADEKVSWQDFLDFEQVSRTLEGVARVVRSGLETVKRSRTGVVRELAIRNGKLAGMLVQGAASAALKVTPEWAGDKPVDD
ncbi:MAG TPA: hypothetical protein VEH05_15530 [Streptosporangiaceae bacterium]|nr:hypothetical protein [Streptosporangiaceae bacterium]